MMNYWFKQFLKLILLISLISHTSCYAPKLVLFSFDAFRSDYLHPKLAPTIYELAKNGVQTNEMRSCYATKTFPNHFRYIYNLFTYIIWSFF